MGNSQAKAIQTLAAKKRKKRIGATDEKNWLYDSEKASKFEQSTLKIL
jgi:hypothetical protein